MEGPHVRMMTAAYLRWNLPLGRAVGQGKGWVQGAMAWVFLCLALADTGYPEEEGKIKFQAGLVPRIQQSLNQQAVLQGHCTPFANHKAALERRAFLFWY